MKRQSTDITAKRQRSVKDFQAAIRKMLQEALNGKLEWKNIILEIKISVVELNRNRRIEGTQERISRLDDRIIEIIQSKQQTEVV